MMHPACGPSIRPSPSDGQETVSQDGTPHASTSTSKLQPCSRAAVSSAAVSSAAVSSAEWDCR